MFFYYIEYMDPAVTKLVVLIIAAAVCIYYGILCAKGDSVLKNGNASNPQSLDASKGYDTTKTGIAGGYVLIFVGALTVLLGFFVFFFPQYLMKAVIVYGSFVVLAIFVLIVLVKTLFTRKP